MQMDRRQVLQGAAAAILAAPAASFATIGDFPKQAFFGSAPISAPFGDTYGQAGSPIWEKLQDTERGIYERILTDTKGHLKDVETFISQPSWDAATAELRLGMQETRKAMVRLTDVSDNSVRFIIRNHLSLFFLFIRKSVENFICSIRKFYFAHVTLVADCEQDSKELYAKFKRQVEALDQAISKKNADSAFRLRAAAEITYGQWLSSVGL
jgi:hypothetical protein